MRALRFVAALGLFLATAARSIPTRADDAASGAAFVRPDHFLAVVIHPRRIAASPLVAAQLKEPLIAEAVKRLGFGPDEVEEIVVLVSMEKPLPIPGLGARRPEPMPTVIARFTHDVDAKEILAKLQAFETPHGEEKITEAQFGGKTCYDPGGMLLAFSAAKDTIVFAPRQKIRKLVTGEAAGPLAEKLKHINADDEITCVYSLAAFADLDKLLDAAVEDAPPVMKNYLRAAKTVKAAALTTNLSGPSLLNITLDAESEEAADNIKDLLESAVRMAMGGLVLGKQSMPPELRTKLATLIKLADQCLDGAKVGKSGKQVTLTVKRPEILDNDPAALIQGMKSALADAREAQRQNARMNNIHQVSFAMIMYEEAQGYFPPAAIGKDGKQLLSWRVAILPYLDQKALYDQFHLDEPWDSPHNLELAKKMPAVYQSLDVPTDGKTRMMLFTGKGAAFDGGKKITAYQIKDGTSYTLLCVEAGADKAVPWTKPEDLPFDPDKPLAALGKFPPEGFNAAFFDGSVHRIKVDNAALKALVTPDGGEVIDGDQIYGR